MTSTTHLLFSALAALALSPGFTSAQVALPSGLSQACQDGVQQCYRTFVNNVLSDMNDVNALCGHMNGMVSCLQGTDCGLSQQDADNILENARSQLAASGVNCDGTGSAMPVDTPNTAEQPCVAGTQTCMKTYFNEIMSSPSDFCPLTNNYLYCMFHIEGCEISAAQHEQIMERTRATVKSRGIECELHANGQSRLGTTATTAWLFVAATVLARSLSRWI